MQQETTILIFTALSLGFFHTLFGPDHYLPFIVMAKARNWNRTKTAMVTLACGLGHVGSSVILGIIGIALGIGVNKLEIFESHRGTLAGWLFIAFGLAYTVWGIRKAIKNKPHTHLHQHENGKQHHHEHTHVNEHTHVHDTKKKNITPWVLFTVFVLGPCEPLIPVLMYPSATNSIHGLIAVVITFTVATLVTMLSVVLISSYGIELIPLKKVERYTHAIAGATILLCGISIQFLGL